LLEIAEPIEAWFSTASQELERHWAGLLEKAPNSRIPIAKFGSSDYHRSRSSHLFYTKRRPSFRWFQQTLREGFEDICTVRYVIPEETGEGEQP
jgi:Uri superfamily endonuclease